VALYGRQTDPVSSTVSIHVSENTIGGVSVQVLDNIEGNCCKYNS
jgi:hypothetical protein